MKWFWIVIELMATVFENFVVINSMNKIFDSKYSDNKKRIGEGLCLITSTAFVSFLN